MTLMRKLINNELLSELKIREDCCCYCGKKLTSIRLHALEYTVDHVYPKGNGGTNSPLNKLPCCRTCNESKGSKSLETFLEETGFRLSLSAGWSKTHRKRLQHMVEHIQKIREEIAKYKSEIYKYKPMNSEQNVHAVRRKKS